MNVRDRHGLTLVEVLAIIVVLAVLAAAIPCCPERSIEQAKCTALKNKARGVWMEVVSANAEREPLGLPSVWPQEMGFAATNSSTAYFQRLMSDTNGCPTEDANAQLTFLQPQMLAGCGVPVAPSARQFGASNNVWCVTRVCSSTPPDAVFLFTRNLAVGAVLTSTSATRILSTKPALNINKRAVWITCGGGVYDARQKFLSAKGLVSSNCPPLAVMRP